MVDIFRLTPDALKCHKQDTNLQVWKTNNAGMRHSEREDLGVNWLSQPEIIIKKEKLAEQANTFSPKFMDFYNESVFNYQTD